MSDSMNTAIDVNYQTEVAIENKSTEQLTAEVNVRYRQAESLASMSLTMLADAGRRLIEIKGRIPHGQFEDWCANNLEFSKSKAEKMMKLAERTDEEGSLFSKTETFTDIGISRVWALLAAPEEVAAEVIEKNDVSEMTVRELKEKIRKLKEEKIAAEARADAADLALNSADAQDLADAQNALEHMKEELERKEENRLAAIEAKDNIAEQLKKAKEKLKAAKAAKDEEVAKAIEAGRADIEKKAKEDALADVAATLGQNSEDINRLEAEVERLEAETAKLSNTTLMEFKVYVDQLQDIYFKINDLISEENLRDEESGAKMQAALQKIVKGWRP